MDRDELIMEETWHIRLVRHYRDSLTDRYFRFAILVSVLVFAASLITSFYAIGYATSAASTSNSVTDLVLSNIPAYDMDGFFVYGTVLLIVFTATLLVLSPRYLPFALLTLAMFWFVRSGFTVLTHIAPYPVPAGESFDLGRIAGRFFFGGDRFFSGHTGAPFLLALIFWHRPYLRTAFLTWSGYFAAVVLLGHLHYSIDVASAFFITFGIYHLCLWLFPREYALFRSAELNRIAAD